MQRRKVYANANAMLKQTTISISGPASARLTRIQDLHIYIYSFCFSKFLILLSTAFMYSVVVT